MSAAACAQLLPPAAGQMRTNNTWLGVLAMGSNASQRRTESKLSFGGLGSGVRD